MHRNTPTSAAHFPFRGGCFSANFSKQKPPGKVDLRINQSHRSGSGRPSLHVTLQPKSGFSEWYLTKYYSHSYRKPFKAEEKCDTPEGSVRTEDPLGKVSFFTKLAEVAPLGKGAFFCSADCPLIKIICWCKFSLLHSFLPLCNKVLFISLF